jgi:hypothetical protein
MITRIISLSRAKSITVYSSYGGESSTFASRTYRFSAIHDNLENPSVILRQYDRTTTNELQYDTWAHFLCNARRHTERESRRLK